MTLAISCECGKFKADLDTEPLRYTNHLRCYCKDCQRFPHYLGKSDQVLDDNGGTEIVQVMAGNVRIVEGKEHLACVRLTEKGLPRWYASCCNTPIGNVPGLSMPFIGVIHSCLTPSNEIESTFGPVRLESFAGSAIGENRPTGRGLIGGILKMIQIILVSKVSGHGKRHPFFSAETGRPIVKPEIAG